MKRTLTILSFLAVVASAKADVIFFPYQYSGVNYSLELVYNHEIIRKPNRSIAYWGGTGVVGSFFFLDKPTFGFEVAIESRRYFKPEVFNKWFFSVYIGTAFMTDLDRYDLGLVPGLKINYKAHITKSFVLEPYFGVSLPITYSLNYQHMYLPFPVATIGLRIGLCKLKKNDNTL